MDKEILKHYYDEGKKFGYALARGATDLPSVQTFDELYTKQLHKPVVMQAEGSDGVSGANLTGLYTTAIAYAFDSGSFYQAVDGANVYDLIAAVRVSIMNAKKKYAPNVVLMNPVDIFKYKVLKGTDGHYLLPPFVGPNGETIMGMRVLESAQVTANTLAVGTVAEGGIYGLADKLNKDYGFGLTAKELIDYERKSSDGQP